MKNCNHINLRCYVETKKVNKSYNNRKIPCSNTAVLVFDTETTSDKYQNLLFGSCGIWINGKPKDFYLFYADNLTENQTKIIRTYAKKHNFKSLSRKDFVENVFYTWVYTAGTKCIGFNLPFDLSRIAIHFGKARKAKNAFSLKLSENRDCPNIRIQHIDNKSSFIQFTTPIRKKSWKKYSPYRGYFLDLKTLTFALTNKSYSLKKALEDFECQTHKMETEEHGVINEQYIEYNVNDTKSTYELYLKAINRYEKYLLHKEPNTLYSPASIGKAYLEKIGIKSFFEKNPNFSKKVLGYCMSTYYGGRTEVRVRKKPIKVSYIDFTSMYPSVFVLLGLHDFLISNRINFKHTKNVTQQFLDKIKLSDVNKKEIWKNFITICKIKPDNDILPVRTNYGGKQTSNIGINYVKSNDDTCLWYTLPDLIASKLLSRKTPQIIDALTFEPNEIQREIKEIEILKEIPLKEGENFIQKLIEERIRIKREIKNAKNLTKEELNQTQLNQNILKIIANATSYGIFIQINSILAQRESVSVHGLDSFETQVEKHEQEGEYFNPIMSIFITAASRLILATAESLVKQSGGYVAYCDTDSIFVSPSHVKLVQEFFGSLNPYSEKVEMFKVEDDGNGKDLHDVWFYGISAKRYVLYDYDEDIITIRKHSAHGLGHILDIDEKEWWKNILAMHYHPELVEKIISKYQNKYSISKITVSTPEMINRFKTFNEKKSYKNKIKPFNFVLVGTGYQINEETKNSIIPLISFLDEKAREQVPFIDFVDYKTSKTYPNENSLDTSFYWKPLSEVLLDYVNHPESKSKGSVGFLKRRYLQINKNSIRYIGKEANNLEESNIIGDSKDNYTEYPRIKDSILDIPPNKSYKFGISRRNLINLQNKIRKNIPIKPNNKTLDKIANYTRLISLRNCTF